MTLTVLIRDLKREMDQKKENEKLSLLGYSLFLLLTSVSVRMIIYYILLSKKLKILLGHLKIVCFLTGKLKTPQSHTLFN